MMQIQLALLIYFNRMKQAARVFSKKKQQHHSPSFISKVQRQTVFTNKLRNKSPGPGQYEVTLPLVKPKYEAIFKKNRSIIIKVNDVPSPGFYSRQPRFKQNSTISYESDSDPPKQFEINDNPIFSAEKHSRRYNFSLAKKRSTESFAKKFILSETIQGEDDLMQSKMKGPIWSKYKQKRPKWSKQVGVPGPGAYDYNENAHQEVVKKSSWQFRSQTKRAFYQNYKQRITVETPEDEGQDFGFSIHNRSHQKKLPV